MFGEMTIIQHSQLFGYAENKTFSVLSSSELLRRLRKLIESGRYFFQFALGVSFSSAGSVDGDCLLSRSFSRCADIRENESMMLSKLRASAYVPRTKIITKTANVVFVVPFMKVT